MSLLNHTSVSRRARIALAGLAVFVALAATGCDEDPVATQEPDTVAQDTTTTAFPEDAPAVAIGGAPGPDGHRPVRVNPEAWDKLATERRDDDATDIYWELRTEGHDDFWLGIELHPDVGLGWTGELGLFATDCEDTGICVRFDPDGSAGPTGPILSRPDGEVEIDQLEGGFVLTFRNLVFVRDDDVSFRIDQVTIDTT